AIHDPAASQPIEDTSQEEQTDPTPTNAVERVVAAAVRAPSGGNAQPWHVSAQDDSVTISLAPEHTSTMDVGYRASAVAVGAAASSARVAAAAAGILGPVAFQLGDDASPLRAVLRFAEDSDPELADLYEPMLARETNRHVGKPVTLPPDIAEALQ